MAVAADCDAIESAAELRTPLSAVEANPASELAPESELELNVRGAGRSDTKRDVERNSVWPSARSLSNADAISQTPTLNPANRRQKPLNIPVALRVSISARSITTDSR